MDRDDVLLDQMTERFQELYNRALDALDQAPDGQWIAASEGAFRDAFVQLMKESDPAGLQSKVDAHPTAQAAAHCVGATMPPRNASAPAPPQSEPTSSAAAFSPSQPGDRGPARAWASKQLHDIKHLGGRPVLAAIDEAKKKLRAPAKQKALRLLRNYIVERWEMVEYPAALAKGWDIGSGPTEAMCKYLTLPLKRPGMKWDTDHAAALMNLVALRESGQWEQYWQTRKIA